MLDNIQIYTGIAKRKTSVAKVFIQKGLGLILINNKKIDEYFKDIKNEYELIQKPYLLLNLNFSYNFNIFVKGGGIYSQLNAIIFAISKALSKINYKYRQILKKELLLRSDSRIKERRKYGLKKARKASQYSKR
jgi:small subunit ribosomal protein S9